MPRFAESRSTEGTLVSAITIRSDVIPSCTLCSVSKLLMSNPAPATRMTDSATSATTPPCRKRRAEGPPPARRTLCLSAEFKSTRNTCSAGASPNTRLATREIASANSKTPPSMPASDSRGTSCGANATIVFTPQYATTTPTSAAPSADRSANRNLSRPPDGARQQHVRQVRARNQQHHSNRSQHHQQGQAIV